MKKLNQEELLQISGGLNITASLINSIARIGNTLLELGRSIGTAIIRLYKGKACKF